MVDAGVIDQQNLKTFIMIRRFRSEYKSSSNLKRGSAIGINRDNAGAILNLLWHLVLEIKAIF